MANASEYGLAAYAYSRDLGRALAVSERLQAGLAGVNRGATSDPVAPFGGMKHSGLGREGGFGGIHEFLEASYIAADGEQSCHTAVIRWPGWTVASRSLQRNSG